MTAPRPGQPAAAPSVTDANPNALAWVALADELTPAKSLARIDSATTRVVANVTVVGTILTGLGLLTAALPSIIGTARGLAIASVVAAVAAVGCALAAQILSIHGDLNTRNIPELRLWYRQQFKRRAYPTRAATILLICGILLAGGASAVALTQPPLDRPVIAIAQTQTAAAKTPAETAKTTVSIEVSFPDIEPSDTLILTVVAGNVTVAKAAITPQPDGTASRTITIPHIPTDTSITATASAGKQRCVATLTPQHDKQPQISCRN